MTSTRRPDRSVDRFDTDPTRSFTLPASYYVDPDVLATEQERIFWRSWMHVGHVSELIDPGAYITADIAGQRVFVIRQESEELRGFFNVCQHRGHSLLEGRGTISGLIKCPYHAWAYGVDGTLQGARMSDRMDGFDFADFTLPELAVETFCGLVFVNLAPDPPPMDEVYPGLADAILDLCAAPEQLVPVDISTYHIAGNWKNVGDNLLECYHCHPAHRAFVDLIDMDTYVNETHESWSIQSGASRDDNSTYDVATGAQGFASIYMWPNVSVGRLPGQDGIFIFRFMPTGPEETLQDLVYYGPSDDQTDTEKAAFAYFNEVLGPEDVALVENVQIGLRSLGYHQGRFICIPDRPEISEHAVHHFHSMVRVALGVD